MRLGLREHVMIYLDALLEFVIHAFGDLVNWYSVDMYIGNNFE